MRLGVTLDILNQKGTPAFFADTLANRPAAGFTGRIFVSTDTLDLYRDTGTTWVLLSPSSTGTITGSGAAGQVTYFSGTSSITGSNNLFWDTANNRLGVNTNTPTASFDVHGTTNTIAQLNQLTTGQNALLAFQDNSVGKWRIGNIYNAAANDFGIVDITNTLQRLTIKNTGQTFIGTETASSGLFVVNSATSDSHIVAIGATAPSIRVRNAGTAPTQQFGLGLATTTNNFVQGSASGDFCIFNGSTTASPILFGINSAGVVNEAARISAARNFLVGTTTDGGQRLQISGSARATSYFLDGMTAGSGALYWTSDRVTLANYNVGGSLVFEINGGTQAAILTSGGLFGLGTLTPNNYSGAANNLVIAGSGQRGMTIATTDNSQTSIFFANSDSGAGEFAGAINYFHNDNHLEIYTNSSEKVRITSNGLVGIGTSTPSTKLQVVGTIAAQNAADGSDATGIRIYGSGTSKRIDFTASDGSVNERISGIGTGGPGNMTFSVSNGSGVLTERMRIPETGNLLISTTTDTGQNLQVSGTTYITGATNIGGLGTGIHQLNVTVEGGANRDIFQAGIRAVSNGFRVVWNNATSTTRVSITNIPTSAVGLSSGDIYSNAGILTIVP